MLQSEFIERTKFEVNAECYHEFIEPEYNGSTLPKDEWCKQWKRNGGIARAYAWQVARNNELKSKFNDLKYAADALQDRLDRTLEDNGRLRENIQDLKKKVEELQKAANKLQAIQNIINR